MGSASEAKGLCGAGGVFGDAERDEYADRGPREDMLRVSEVFAIVTLVVLVI